MTEEVQTSKALQVNPEKLALSLIASDSDEPLRSDDYQKGLAEVASALKAQGIKVSFQMDFEESASSHSFLLGQFTIELAKAVGRVICAVIGAWLQAKYGEKHA